MVTITSLQLQANKNNIIFVQVKNAHVSSYIKIRYIVSHNFFLCFATFFIQCDFIIYNYDYDVIATFSGNKSSSAVVPIWCPIFFISQCNFISYLIYITFFSLNTD